MFYPTDKAKWDAWDAEKGMLCEARVLRLRSYAAVCAAAAAVAGKAKEVAQTEYIAEVKRQQTVFA